MPPSAIATLLLNQTAPGFIGGVIAILTGVGRLASYLPSIRATRVDPAISLRCE